MQTNNKLQHQTGLGSHSGY